MSEILARVIKIKKDGQLLLEDPAAEGMIAAVAEHNLEIAQANCNTLYRQNFDRVQHFRSLFDDGKYQASESCIVLIQVDDEHGGPISDLLMPGYDWQSIRDQGLEPIARGVANRQFVHDAIELFDEAAAAELDATKRAVVVIASQIAKIFAV